MELAGAIGLVLLLLALVGAMAHGWFRKPRPRGTAWERAHVVAVDDRRIACRDPKGSLREIAWTDLQEVLLVTTGDGPFAPDVFWVLRGVPPDCTIPHGATGAQALLNRLFDLPNFDFATFTAAMASTSDRQFVCWRRPP